MQLLQKLRDSSNIESIKVEVNEIESYVRRELVSPLNTFLTQCKGSIIVYSYTGYGYIPASILYWYYLTMSSSKYPLLMEAEDTAIYMAPYREDFSTLILSTGEYSRLISALQGIRILGIEYKAITPQPSDERLRFLLKHYDVYTIPYRNIVEAVLALAMGSVITASNMYRSHLTTRGQRLFQHASEGFSTVLESLIEKYIPILERVLNQREIIVSSSRFLDASSKLLSYTLRRIGIVSKYVSLEEAIELDEPVLMISLSVEERAKREFIATSRSPIIELVLNTDPLEASIYIVLIAYTLYRSSNL